MPWHELMEVTRCRLWVPDQWHKKRNLLLRNRRSNGQRTYEKKGACWIIQVFVNTANLHDTGRLLRPHEKPLQHCTGAVGREGLVHLIPILTLEYLLPSSSGFQDSLLLIFSRHGPNTCSDHTKVRHRTYPICDAPLLRYRGAALLS